MNKVIILTILPLVFCNCAKNVSDVVAPHDRTMGVFEPAQDYLVDIPMTSKIVKGNAKGTVILGIFTLGGSEMAEGVSLNSRGDSSLHGGALTTGSSGVAGVFNSAVSGVGAVVAPITKLIPDSPKAKFKKAALRNACDLNNCDVIGYPMYNVDEKNYFLWKNYNVSVRGFPGLVQGVQTVPRQWSSSDKDTYWRKDMNDHSRPSFSTSRKSSLDMIEQRLSILNQQFGNMERRQKDGQ
jgi:hypothetical protein